MIPIVQHSVYAGSDSLVAKGSPFILSEEHILNSIILTEIDHMECRNDVLVQALGL